MFASGCSLFNYGENEKEVALSTPLAVTYTQYKAIRGSIERSVSGTCELVTEDSELEKCYFKYGSLNGDNSVFLNYSVKTGQEVNAGDVIVTTTDGHTLKAKTSGTITYLNSEYSNLKKTNKAIQEGTIMAVIDPKDTSKAKLIWNTSSEAIEDFEIGVGTQVELHTSGSNAVTFTGIIDCDYSENLIDIGDSGEMRNWENNTQRSFSVKVENLPDSVKVGDRISVKYVAEKYDDAILIPKEAVDTYRGKTFVYVQDSQGLKREKYVTTGISSDTMIQILEGLNEGDLIIQY